MCSCIFDDVFCFNNDFVTMSYNVLMSFINVRENVLVVIVVNPSHTNESWKGQYTWLSVCIHIYKYIHIYTYTYIYIYIYIYIFIYIYIYIYVYIHIYIYIYIYIYYVLLYVCVCFVYVLGHQANICSWNIFGTFP